MSRFPAIPLSWRNIDHEPLAQAIGTRDLQSAQHEFGALLPHDSITAALQLLYELNFFSVSVEIRLRSGLSTTCVPD